nr:PREDICTED: C-type lectin domain family 4 member K-like [Anolis carolinensis]XP_016853774.1 PREDICTED: C-type lectin domain family 4 member K-like [Anolis carolinensis]|eukprot:XP_016853773.1 PREDICTED: C-type lectin domain family 4 member K-like [Anolis carolinensis]
MERGKTNSLRAGAKKITKFMRAHEPRLRTLLDSEVLEETLKYAETLASWRTKIIELDEAITDITRKITKDWEVFGGSLFLFHMGAQTYVQAIHTCSTRDSSLATIDTPAEEEFIESHVKGKHVDYWIGLHKQRIDWIWLEDTPVRQMFWSPGAPINKGLAGGDTENCVFVDKHCTLNKQCWRDSLCTSLKRAICRIRPNEKWMY